MWTQIAIDNNGKVKLYRNGAEVKDVDFWINDMRMNTEQPFDGKNLSLYGKAGESRPKQPSQEWCKCGDPLQDYDGSNCLRCDKMIKPAPLSQDKGLEELVGILRKYKTCKGISLTDALQKSCHNSKKEGIDGELYDLAQAILNHLERENAKQ